jgi:mRNA interferase HigB
VNIFTKRALSEASTDHKEAAGDIVAWLEITKQAQWTNFVDLKVNFPSADDVDGVVVFNIRHNRFRLLTVVKYSRDVEDKHINGSVFVRAFMTHAEYDRWSELSKQKREKMLWPQS